MTTQISETFNEPIGFHLSQIAGKQDDLQNCEKLLVALHDLLIYTEATDVFNRPEITDENFSRYKQAYYFESQARGRARQLLREAGHLP